MTKTMRTLASWALGAAWITLLPIAAGAEDLEASIPMQPGGRLKIDIPSGRIEVESHDDPVVEIDGYASGRFRFQLEEKDDEVIVRGRSEGILPWFTGRVEINVRVPTRFDLDLSTNGGRIDIQDIEGDVKAHTSGGRIELEEIRGQVEVHTSGGRIQAQEIQGDLDAETSGGAIHVSEVSGDVDVRTSGGRIRVREVGGEVKAHTSGGPIEVRFVGPPAGALETSGGGIEVDVPVGYGFDLQAETSGGRVELDRELQFDGESERAKIQGRIGGGGPSLDVKTSGGNVRIRMR